MKYLHLATKYISACHGQLHLPSPDRTLILGWPYNCNDFLYSVTIHLSTYSSGLVVLEVIVGLGMGAKFGLIKEQPVAGWPQL